MVYCAKQLKLDRIVALKMLNENMEVGSTERLRFEREAFTLSSLKHRNLLMVYGSGFWQGSPYINMEYVDGISLEQTVDDNGAMETKRAIAIVCQILDGLASAHAHGVVHRDLKPGNVMLVQRGSEEVVKIIDFGLAKIISDGGVESQSLTAVGYAVGSVKYMSPEQCLARKIDHRSDIYATGCILNAVLTGKHVFGGDNSAIVMMQHVQAPPVPLSEILGSSPYITQLQWVLNKALAKDPEERYQSADEMSKDLRLIAKERGAEVSCKNSSVSTTRLGITSDEDNARKAPLLIVGGVAVFAVGIVLALLFWPLLKVSAPENSALVFDAALKAESVGDNATAAKLYQKALLLKKSDGSLSLASAVTAARSAAGYYFEKDPALCARCAKAGIEETLEVHAPVSDPVMTLSVYYLVGCNHSFHPNEGIPVVEHLLSIKDPILTRNSQYKVQRSVAESYSMLGNAQIAQAYLTRSNRMRTTDTRISYADRIKGNIAFTLGNYRRALVFWTKSYGLAPNYEGLLSSIARAQIALGNWSSAEATMASMKPSQQSNCSGLGKVGVLAVLAAHKGDFEPARKFVVAMRLDESNAVYYKATNMDFDLKNLIALAKEKDPSMVPVLTEFDQQCRRMFETHLESFIGSDVKVQD